MKPPLPHSESTVPRTLHAQLEIAEAMRMLMAPDEAELLYQRRAEIAAIRGELEAIKRDFQKAGEECLALVKAELRAALAKNYNPDQPRVPAGNRDGGQWTSGSEAGGQAQSISVSSPAAVSESSGAPIRYASLENPIPGTRIDAMGGEASIPGAEALDPLNLRSLRDAFSTAFLSYLGRTFNVIRSYEIMLDDPKRPVQFFDSSGRAILDDQGSPILRPNDLPPEKYAEAGIASHLADYVEA